MGTSMPETDHLLTYSSYADSTRARIYEQAQADPPHGSDHPKAVDGPWSAVLYDSYGFLVAGWYEVGHDAGWAVDTATVAVVRGSASPVEDRMPGAYQSGDVLYRHEGLDLHDDGPDGAAHRWAQARMVAALLNANQDKLDAVAEFRQVSA